MATSKGTAEPAAAPPEAPKRPSCGIVRPISPIDSYTAEHWAELQEIVEEALGESYEVRLVSQAEAIGVIQNHIVNNLFHDDIVVAIISGQNPNVMLELGMRLAFDKPVVILRDDLTSIPFDFAPLEVLTYPRGLRYGAMKSLKVDLLRRVDATLKASKQEGYKSYLKHFGPISTAEIGTEAVNVQQAILEQLSQLRGQLLDLRRQGESQPPFENPFRNAHLHGLSSSVGKSFLSTSSFGGGEPDPFSDRSFARYLRGLSKKEERELEAALIKMRASGVEEEE